MGKHEMENVARRNGKYNAAIIELPFKISMYMRGIECDEVGWLVP